MPTSIEPTEHPPFITGLRSVSLSKKNIIHIFQYCPCAKFIPKDFMVTLFYLITEIHMVWGLVNLFV